MGFLDKLRAELVDIIEWVDDSRHTLVWRFPRYHNQIKYGAQLIVRPGQSAVFVHQGRVADVFGPGQHRLETRNLPVLSTLAGWFYGFDSPFKAEVYFVSTRTITDLKWGTPNPVMMRDRDYGPIRVRGFGTYTLRARDPKTLIKELVATDSTLETEEIAELLRSVICESFAGVIAKAELSIVDLASSYAELAEQVRRASVSRIDDEFGLELPQLFLVNVSVPAEVEEAFDARSGMGLVGDLQAYQAYRLGQSIPTAAANPAGGLAAAGVGVGMGVAMANRFSAHPAASAPPPSAPPPVPALWHWVENGQAVGPFSREQLQQAATAGRVAASTLVWSAGMAEWMPAANVPALAGLIPPPLPGR